MKTKIINNIELSMILGMIVTAILCGFFDFDKNYNEITNNVFRLHILANSDCVEDQQLKLKVRDKILESSAYLFDNSMSKENTVETVNANLDKLQAVAKKTLMDNGCDYDVKCEITEMYFEDKIYRDITMPAGNYTALRITIGEAEGHNWWCVMYPPLCLPAVTNTEEFMKEYEGVITEEELEMLQNPENYEVKFYFAELIQKLIDEQDSKL